VKSTRDGLRLLKAKVDRVTSFSEMQGKTTALSHKGTDGVITNSELRGLVEDVYELHMALCELVDEAIEINSRSTYACEFCGGGFESTPEEEEIPKIYHEDTCPLQQAIKAVEQKLA
jgi:hypothetical protein